MIIRDLDHCKLEAKVNKFQKMAGGASFVNARFNLLAQGFNAGVESYFDAISVSSPSGSLAGYSYAVLLIAE